MKRELDKTRFRKQYNDEDWKYLIGNSAFERAWLESDPNIQDLATELLHGSAITMEEWRRLRENQKKRYG
jgi:hypothetical protein